MGVQQVGGLQTIHRGSHIAAVYSVFIQALEVDGGPVAGFSLFDILVVYLYAPYFALLPAGIEHQVLANLYPA